MRTRLRLFLDWGITFGDAYLTPEHGQRKVYYADRKELETAILNKHSPAETAFSAQPVWQEGAQSRPQHLHRKTEGDSSSLRT